jgi:hypothetical protein
MCPLCSKEEDWSLVFGLEGTEILDERFVNIDAEIAARSKVGCKNVEQWQKIGIYYT